MKKTSIAALALTTLLGLGAVAQAQMGHGHHGGQGPAAAQPGAPGDMDRMMGMMRQMMPMMERMRTATPAERERTMADMRPLMQGMMPMMQAMMGGHGMGHGTGAAPGGAHQGHAEPSAAAAPSTRAFEEANARMHRDMAIAFTGHADVDFVRGMIPHHQGAIDMARVVLEHGRDDWVKNLAGAIIAAQTKEIAEMQDWITKHSRWRR